MIVTAGTFSEVRYEVTASELTAEILTVWYDNPTKTARSIRIAAPGIEWSGVLEAESNETLTVDPGIPAATCSVSLS